MFLLLVTIRSTFRVGDVHVVSGRLIELGCRAWSRLAHDVRADMADGEE